MWRVRLDDEPDVVVRLPRRPGAAAGVEKEVAVLRQLDGTRLRSIVKTPAVRHVGQPSDRFPHRWTVLEWIEGTDAWVARSKNIPGSIPSPGERLFAQQLAELVIAIGEVTPTGVLRREPGDRGGPLGPLLARLDRWLTDPQWEADRLIDVGAVRRLADAAGEVVDEPVEVGFVHGDLIPGNLLLVRGGLDALIDWGGAAIGDRAQDFAPAWALLTATGRAVFRGAVEADDAAWIRGRAFELEHAVGGILYYVPRRHPLGDVMTRTLARILDESTSPTG